MAGFGDGSGVLDPGGADGGIWRGPAPDPLAQHPLIVGLAG